MPILIICDFYILYYLLVTIDSKTGGIEGETVDKEEVTAESIVNDDSLKEPTRATSDDHEEPPLDNNMQLVVQLTELLKDEPPKYNLFDPTLPCESADSIVNEVTQDDSDIGIAKLSFDDDGDTDMPDKVDSDSPSSVETDQANDTKRELMELLLNDDQDSC